MFHYTPNMLQSRAFITTSDTPLFEIQIGLYNGLSSAFSTTYPLKTIVSTRTIKGAWLESSDTNKASDIGRQSWQIMEVKIRGTLLAAAGG